MPLKSRMDRYFQGLKRNILYSLIAGVIIFAVLWLLQQLQWL